MTGSAIRRDRESARFSGTTAPSGFESPAFDSEAEAREFLDGEVAGNHRLADALHVIPRAELWK